MLLRLALRNKRRTALSSAAVVAGVFFLIAGRSLIGGMNEGIFYATIYGMVGHVTLRPAGYPDIPLSHPIDHLLPLGPKQAGALDAAATHWTERLIFHGTATAGLESQRVRVIGFDPLRDPKVFAREQWEVAGRVPASAGDGLLVSGALAELLQVEAGGRLVLQARTHQGAINALDLPIAGVVDTGNMATTNSTIFMPLAAARDFTRAESPTHVSLLLANRDKVKEVAAALLPHFPGAEVIDWIGESEDLMKVQAFRMAALNMFVSILMVMSSLAIANTILMAAHERVREIGTLRAMGMSRRGVLALFLLEGAIMGSLAGLLGTLLGGGLALRLRDHPIDFSEMTKGIASNVNFSLYLYGRFDLPLLLWPLLISLLVAVIASVYPAIFASRLQPADAVRA
jgi:putative ABC transport system permease protein